MDFGSEEDRYVQVLHNVGKGRHAARHSTSSRALLAGDSHQEVAGDQHSTMPELVKLTRVHGGECVTNSGGTIAGSRAGCDTSSMMGRLCIRRRFGRVRGKTKEKVRMLHMSVFQVLSACSGGTILDPTRINSCVQNAIANVSTNLAALAVPRRKQRISAYSAMVREYNQMAKCHVGIPYFCPRGGGGLATLRYCRHTNLRDGLRKWRCGERGFRGRTGLR